MPPATRGSDRDDGGWHEYRRLVLNELERVDESLKDVNIKLGEIERNLTMLQAKATVWGALGGVVVSIIVSVIVALVLNSMGLKQ